MENYNKIQWNFMETAERVEKISFKRKMLYFMFHFVGVLYLIILYFNSFTFGFTVQLIFVYILGLLVWYLFLNKILIFKEKRYTMSDQGIEILEIKTNKSYIYKWEDFKSFSENPAVYQPKSQNKNIIYKDLHDKYYYLGLKKFSFIPFVELDVDQLYIEKVYNALKAKLSEAK